MLAEFLESSVLLNHWHAVGCSDSFVKDAHSYSCICFFFLDSSFSGSYVSPCSTAVPDMAGKTEKSTHFTRQKPSQKTRSIESLQKCMKPKSSCEYYCIKSNSFILVFTKHRSWGSSVAVVP
jgi:hypothetical protein